MTTIKTLQSMKQSREKIACLTSYDASFTHLLEQAGVDVILVGDSLGMVVQGMDSTVSVTVDDVIYHTRAVSQGRRSAFLMADMPFMSYSTIDLALQNAARLMREGGAHMVKLEGSANQADVVASLVTHGVPVCAHLGLRPQFIHKLGGYKVQGRDQATASALLNDAKILENAGADMLLLECVPAVLAAEITACVSVPVIGIGAGKACDGQILVLYDILGLAAGKSPKFCKNFLLEGGAILQAVEDYVAAVKNSTFPGPEHTFV